MTLPRPDRRAVLGGLALGAAALSPAAALARGRAPLDPVADLALIHRKLVWSGNADLTFSWLRGVRYALIDNRLLPLWDMHVGTIFRTRDLADGYEVAALSTSFYTDLQTGRFLESFHNPITGATLPITYYPPQPQRIVYGASGRVAPTAGFLARLDQHVEIGPAWFDGDTVAVASDYRAYSPDASPTPGVRVNDLSTNVGRLAEVADPHSPNPPATLIFNDLNTWPAWLGMGDRPGSYVSRAWGRKAFAWTEMPPVWRDLMQSRYPKIAADPAGPLGL
jgi:hypothetical protein